MKKLLLMWLFAANTVWANTITITVAHLPGGAPDAWTRIVAKYLSQELGDDFVIVNKPAADGRVAIDHVASLPADGKNLITVSTGPFLFNKVLFKKLNTDYTSFEMMAPMARVPLVLSVSHALGVTNLAEFIDLARRRSLNCAGSSSSSVFVGKQFFHSLKINLVQFVPFKGSADMNVQLAAGNIDCAFDTSLATIPLHKGNRFKIIAASTESTFTEVPEAALFSTIIPGFSFYNWYGIGMRANSPGADRIFSTLRRIQNNQAFREEVKKRGIEIVTPPPSGSQWIHQEYQKFELARQQMNIDKLD